MLSILPLHRLAMRRFRWDCCQVGDAIIMTTSDLDFELVQSCISSSCTNEGSGGDFMIRLQDSCK